MPSEKIKNDLEQVTILYEISKALGEHMDLKKSLYKAMEILANQENMLRGTITLLNPVTGEIHIEVAHGLSKGDMAKGIYKLGEGVTGTVIKEGRPIAIERISQAPSFLKRTTARKKLQEDFSFICVPITEGSHVRGALSADMPHDPEFDLEQGVQFLSIIATMLARHVGNLERIRLEQERLKAENRRLQDELEKKYHFTNIIGNSSKMREVFRMISQVSKSNTPVLIRGESGTGKGLVASALHYNSNRAEHPFIKVNCAALPEDLIESELFGHERSAFTGAVSQKKGKIEAAGKGTLFLDEMGSISQEVQGRLLRLLQDREFERVGGNQTLHSDVRILAATGKNLEQAVEEGTFRGDLYYRLNVFPIYLPPLRERKTDILLLGDYFLEKYAKENGKEIKRFSTSAIDMLMDYHWPGNVRELENCIERAVLLCEEGAIHAYHLPPTLQTGEDSGSLPVYSLDEAVARLEKEMIMDALKNTGGNISQAAELLGTTIRIFSYKCKAHGIHYKDYRQKREEAASF
ncbi:sigma 54-interacting transcriptional regulator [Desulfococcaceae bacterium OttesenSCG-928-F15]|nr:sigma 54-interacting transcriptional regulator [Desulfococcaceae bacterium OttesenSCG-928-F15]